MKQGRAPVTGQRGDRLLRERVHDPYKTRLKLPEPTVCVRLGTGWRAPAREGRQRSPRRGERRPPNRTAPGRAVTSAVRRSVDVSGGPVGGPVLTQLGS